MTTFTHNIQIAYSSFFLYRNSHFLKNKRTVALVDEFHQLCNSPFIAAKASKTATCAMEDIFAAQAAFCFSLFFYVIKFMLSNVSTRYSSTISLISISSFLTAL